MAGTQQSNISRTKQYAGSESVKLISTEFNYPIWNFEISDVKFFAVTIREVYQLNSHSLSAARKAT